MRHTLENQTLTLFLEGELNSYNSEDVEKEIEPIVAAGGFSSIVVDMDALRYISSAGLRIIVRLKQQCDDITLARVPQGVYDILDMVGFPNLMRIQKRED